MKAPCLLLGVLCVDDAFLPTAPLIKEPSLCAATVVPAPFPAQAICHRVDAGQSAAGCSDAKGMAWVAVVKKMGQAASSWELGFRHVLVAVGAEAMGPTSLESQLG